MSKTRPALHREEAPPHVRPATPAMGAPGSVAAREAELSLALDQRITARIDAILGRAPAAHAPAHAQPGCRRAGRLESATSDA